MFEVQRPDGRSDVVVVLSVFAQSQPDEVITYDTLAATLDDGERTFTRQAVQSIVGRAKPQFLRLHQRAVEVVPNVGYRVVRASEHSRLAAKERRKGERCYRQALRKLQHVHLEELAPSDRIAHEAQLLLTQSVMHRVTAMEYENARRDAVIESVVAQRPVEPHGEMTSLIERLDALEKRVMG